VLDAVQVVCACLAGYTVHWFERQQRLRFKQQMPPAVAAMQPHLFGLPPGLMVAQVSQRCRRCDPCRTYGVYDHPTVPV
jgi:hypothetical protein